MKKKIKANFLKLVLLKLFFTIIIFFILSGISFLLIFSNPCLDPTPECEEFKESPTPLSYGILGIIFLIFAWPFLITSNITLATLISFIWVYFIVSITIGIYNRLKTKKRKKIKINIIEIFIVLIALFLLGAYSSLSIPQEPPSYNENLTISVINWPGNYVFSTNVYFNISIENVGDNDIHNAKLKFSKLYKNEYSDWNVEALINNSWINSENGEIIIGDIKAKSSEIIKILIMSWCGGRGETEERSLYIRILSDNKIIYEQYIGSLMVCYRS